MRKCDKDGRDCCVCTDICVLTTDGPPAPLKPLYERVAQAAPHEVVFCTAAELATLKDTANPKDAMGAAKAQMGLVPLVEAVARVMELGARKYGPFNWRSKAVKKMVYVHAALRHLMAWVGGQSIDPESGESHLAHVAACMLIVLDAEAHGKAIEDRAWLPQEGGK